jgi:type IV secretion system protein VirD4
VQRLRHTGVFTKWHAARNQAKSKPYALTVDRGGDGGVTTNDGLADFLFQFRIHRDRLAASPFWAGKDTRLHKARYAKPHELAALMGGTTPMLETSLLLGIGPYNRVLRVTPTAKHKELGNLLVEAPARRGKGLLAMTQLLTWPHSVVVNDIKGELFEKTAAARAKLGPVYVVAPTLGVGHSFNPLHNCRTEEDFREMAIHLLYKTYEKEADPFTKRAVKMLKAIFQAGYLEGLPIFPYIAHLLHLGPNEIAHRLQKLSEQHNLPPQENLAVRFLDRPIAEANLADPYFESTWSSLTADMDGLITQTVLKSISGSDFTAEDLLCGKEIRNRLTGERTRKPVTVYFRFPENRLRALAPLIRLIWTSLVDDLTALHDDRKGKGCIPLLLLVDEAGNAPVPALPRLSSTVVGREISLAVLVQDHNQLFSVYGPHGAKTILNNMENQIYYGQYSLDTAEYVQKRGGSKSEYAHSKTMHGDEEAAAGEVEQAVPLVTLQDVTELDLEEVICFHRNVKPYRGKRIDMREYPELYKQTKLPPPLLPSLPNPPEIPSLPEEEKPQADAFGPMDAEDYCISENGDI